MMRNKLGIVVITAAVLLAPNLIAADAPKNAFSFSFSNSDPSIAYRRSFGQFAALVSGSYGQFSYDYSQSGTPDDRATAHAWMLGAGLRRYLATKTALQPFVQLDVSRSVPAASAAIVGPCGSTHYTSGALTGGGEYHVSPSISIEARAGLQGSKYTSRCSGSDFYIRNDTRTLTTFRSAVALNFYF